MPRHLRSARLRAAAAPVALALAAAAALALAVAQGAPRIGVSPIATSVGGVVTLRAEGLPPGEEHTVVLTAPSGAETATVTASDALGALELDLVLEEPGEHRLRLVGAEVEALFVIRADGAAAPPDPAPEMPPDRAPEAAPELDGDAPPAERPAEPREPRDEPAPPTTEGLAIVVDEGVALLLGRNGEIRWRFERPPESGGTRAAILHLGRAWVAHGHTVIEIDVERGHVLRRTPLSGPIIDMRTTAEGVRATVEIVVAGGTFEHVHRVAEGFVTPVATFDPSSMLFTWWLREADAADPAAAIATDATNPHLHVRVAEAAATAMEREEHVEAALETATTFYDLAYVARGLVGIGEHEAADEAMRGALADFEARGYDTQLLTDPAVHERYGFPLRPLRQAVDRGDRAAADFWAPWLVATAAPDLPSAPGTLRRYADMLQAAGEGEEAAAWREQAGRFGAVSTRTVLGDMALGLGRGGWYAAAALLVATALLHLTLLAKYWRAQSLLLRQERESGGRVGPLARWRYMRYFGLTEKLALLLMLAATLTVAALAVWSSAGDAVVRAASAGHLDAPFVRPVIELAHGDPARVAGIEGYRAARRGDAAAARSAYEAAHALGDPDAGRALDALAAGERVPAPSRLALREAVSGSWSRAVGRAFVNPFGLVADGVVAPRVPAWAWPAIVTLFVIVALAHVVTLFVPRPRVARNAPRTLAYHALSLLVPGSGGADELYGVLLLVPTAVFGLDALMQLFGSGSPLGIPLRTSAWILGTLYVANLVAVAVEFASYRRRMEALRREQPDLARAYGMRELPAEA